MSNSLGAGKRCFSGCAYYSARLRPPLTRGLFNPSRCQKWPLSVVRVTVLGLPAKPEPLGHQSTISKLGIQRKIRGGHVLISRCTTTRTRPKCWITSTSSTTTATFASLLRGVPIHADTPAQPETYRTARPSAGPGLGVKEASWVVDRKSRTAISWPSSQRLRHRAKGRLSLGDPVGRTR